MGLFDSVARQFDDEPGGGLIEKGPIGDSSNVFETQYRATTGLVDPVMRQFDGEAGGGFYETGANTDDRTESVFGFDWTGDRQENPLLTGSAKTAYDYVFEYDQTLNGESDSQDLAGRNLATTWDGTVDAANNASDWAGGPGNLAGIILYAAIAAGALYLLGPLFELFAALLGE